jgi:two-component system LytT family sensor kinase
MSPPARASYELHESANDMRARFPLRPGEIAAILAFWAFLAALSGAGRLIDPRVPDLRPDISQALVTLSFIEYSMWALITIAIMMLAHRFTIASSRRARRLLFFIALGIVIAIVVDTVLWEFRHELLPPPRGRGGAVNRTLLVNILRFEFLDDFMVYMAVLGAALARDSFLRYQARLDETVKLAAHTARLEAQLAGARLDALRTQLNPHFLFNTLNAVSSLVERDPRGVRKMIARLGDLLRHTLEDTTDREITLERELGLLKLYLEIMEVRFQGRLSVDLRIPTDVRDALVPTLILQPLVENALTHGVAAIDAPGKVEVSGKRDGNWLVLRVSDNGPGPSGNESGVGLSNTMARLHQLYGTEQRFELRKDDVGAVAEIALPYHTAPRD